MAEIHVRSLSRADEGAWRRLFDDYIAFYRAEVADDVIRSTFERILSRADGMAGLVAINEASEVVGLANIIFHRSTWSQTWYCYLEDLYVDPNARGAGAGRALIEAVYEEADKRQVTRVYWVTEAGNADRQAALRWSRGANRVCAISAG